ncbi:hypothetical protein ACJMK2_022849 [Sinanodonta woodiana]|uniref:Iodothyronine deiodinase n=1 Tax=Sinanodonta woodiana TaxID=1069815 RepID=A0ABD3TK99_SINWO
MMLERDYPAPFPVVVDTMKNDARRQYGAYPERRFVVKDGVIIYAGGVGPLSFDPLAVRRILLTL